MNHFAIFSFLLFLNSLFWQTIFAFIPSFHSSYLSSQILQSRVLRIHSSLEDTTQESRKIEIPPLSSLPAMKILMVIEPSPFTYISGYRNRFQETLKYLKEANDEVVILTPEKDFTTAPTHFHNYPIHFMKSFSLYPLYPDVHLAWNAKETFLRVYENFKPDLVHVSTPSIASYAISEICSKLKIPLVFSYHTDIIKYAQTYLKYLPLISLITRLAYGYVLQRGDLVLATSPQLEQELKSFHISSTDVWRKGINTEVFSSKFFDSKMRHQLTKGNSDAPLLLYVGRLGKEKRLSRLIKVLEQNPGVHLAVVGKGPDKEYLESLFRKYPVYFAGEMTGETLSKAFASSDLFVMPSNTETLGFVVMESLASGVPVVGVRAGGIPDIIEDGFNGYLVEDDDNMLEFSSKVKFLLNNPIKRKEMSKNAKNWSNDWSWSAATSFLRNVQYRKAIQNREKKN